MRFGLQGLLAVLAACSWYSIALAQDKAKPEKKRQTMSTYATCYEESTGKLVGSHKARTAVLVSPDGKFRTYAESEAAASTTNDGTVPECQNISKLYVAGAAGQEFHVVLELKPDSETLGKRAAGDLLCSTTGLNAAVEEPAGCPSKLRASRRHQ